MTVELLRLSTTPEDGRNQFIERFTTSMASLRGGDFASHAPSVQYADAVVSTALRRPAELLLAADGERAIGRALVAASVSRPDAAALGLFEADIADDPERIGGMLIDAATTWALEKGCTELFAPVDLSTWFGYRFLLRPDGLGANIEPHEWEPAQPDRYIQLFRDRGFDVAEHFHTQGAVFEGDGDGLNAVVRHTARAHDAARDAGYTFERLTDGAGLEKLLGEMHPLCMEAFRENPLFEPLPEELFRRLYVSSAGTRDCSLTHTVRDPAGALVGFIFAFTDGDAVVVKTIALAPAHRGQHLSTALAHLMFARGAERGYRHFISALVRRGNTSDFLANPSLLHGTRIWRHEYVLLRRELA